jgi:hypothetical protein
MQVILSIAAVASLIFGFALYPADEYEWVEGVAILMSVFIVILTTALNDYQNEQQFKALQSKQVCVCVCGACFGVILNFSGLRGHVWTCGM